jgi:hypothetical protein
MIEVILFINFEDKFTLLYFLINKYLFVYLIFQL